VGKIKPHLVTERAQCAGAGTIVFLHTVVADVPQ